jgi:hypothetical protein
VGGNYDGLTTQTNSNRAVLFDTATKGYTMLSPSVLPMLGSIGCAMTPDSDGTVVVCAGGSHHTMARGSYYFDQ